MWADWWFWIAGGLLLGALEILVPGYVLVGSAIGAGLTGGLIALGWLGGSLPPVLAVFAVLSLLAWVGLRAALGRRAGNVKVITRDINEN